MRRFLLVLSITPIVASLGLCLASLKFAAACPGANSCSVTGNATEYFDTGDPQVAEFDIHVTWATVGIPAIGHTFDTINSSGVTNVTYTPAYFFPEACEGERDITVRCELEEEECSTSTLVTRLETGGVPNYCLSQTHHTTIECP